MSNPSRLNHPKALEPYLFGGLSPNHTLKQTTTTDDLPLVPWVRVEGFIGQLAHDIRNGLNAVELQLTFLGEISTDPEAVDEIKRLRNTLANVTRQLQSLRTGIGAALPYSLEYPAEDFFDDLRERFVKLTHDASSKVLWEINLGSEVVLKVDPDLTINALLELLANGLHFTRAEALPIRVQVSAIDGGVSFLLQEPQQTEPTVTPEEWGRAPLLTTRRGAYGLGLFRVRRGLESQGGTLDVEYSSAQQSLTTRVTLPGAPTKQP